MSTAIKPGDLVMVVKPRACCGDASSLGVVSHVQKKTDPIRPFCRACGYVEQDAIDWVWLDGWSVCSKLRLKKIDPPAMGDSLPTRADLGVLA